MFKRPDLSAKASSEESVLDFLLEYKKNQTIAAGEFDIDEPEGTPACYDEETEETFMEKTDEQKEPPGHIKIVMSVSCNLLM